MNAMRVTVSDTTGTSGTVTAERSKVAAAIRPWFIDASPQVHAAIDRLQQSLDRAPADQIGTEEPDLSTTRLCAFLGIELGLADADRQQAALTGESKPKSTDEIPSGNKPIEGVGTSTAGMGGGSDGEMPVVLVVVLVVVSAIGSGFGVLLARKAKRRTARRRGS